MVTANRTYNADLLWGCCGGGGNNFGVVTTFILQVPPSRVTARPACGEHSRLGCMGSRRQVIVGLAQMLDRKWRTAMMPRGQVELSRPLGPGGLACQGHADTPAHVAQPVSAACDTLAAAGPRVRPRNASALDPTTPCSYVSLLLHGPPADALPAVCRLSTLRRRSQCSSWASQGTPRWMPSVFGRSGRPTLTTGTRPACSSALRAMSQVCVCVH